MHEAVVDDSVSRPWPGSKHVLQAPWPQEQAVIDDLNLAGQPGGRYVLAAACLDYAYLSDVAEASRVAWGTDAAAVPPEERDMLAGDYQQIYETPTNRQRIDQAVCQAIEMGRAVPPAERAGTIEAGRQFLDLTAGAGHIAVRHFMETLKFLDQPTV